MPYQLLLIIATCILRGITAVLSLRSLILKKGLKLSVPCSGDTVYENHTVNDNGIVLNLPDFTGDFQSCFNPYTSVLNVSEYFTLDSLDATELESELEKLHLKEKLLVKVVIFCPYTGTMFMELFPYEHDFSTHIDTLLPILTEHIAASLTALIRFRMNETNK